MEVKHEDEGIPYDLKGALEKSHRVFQDLPKGVPPSRYHEREIEIESSPPYKSPYRYPHQQKEEIDKFKYKIC